MQTTIFNALRAKGIFLGGRRDHKDVYLTRLQRIKKEGSPYYHWNVPVTAAAAISTIHVPDHWPMSRKYSPLDWLEIVNNGAVNLTLIINGTGGEYLNVPAASTRPVIGKALWWIGIRNDDALNPTILGLVTVTVRRQPKTIDQVAQEL